VAALRRVEKIAWTVGILLLAFWAAARIHSRISSRRDLERFAALKRTPTALSPLVAGTPPASPVPAETPEARSLPEPGPPDDSLWSRQRIKAYENSLTETASAPMAILRIPKIGLEVAVLDGTDDLTLNRAVGHIENTARPGEPGNVGIAGHRDGFFRGLKDVVRGDTMELETLSGQETYRVADIWIVRPEDVQVLDPTPEPAITLVACYPFYFVGHAPQRYIVRAVRTETQTASSSH